MHKNYIRFCAYCLFTPEPPHHKEREKSMKVCYTGGAVTDHGSYYAVATNAVELRIWFLTDDILRIRAGTLRLIVVRDPTIMQQTVRRIDDLKASLRDAQQRYEKLIGSAEERAAYERFKVAEQGYLREQEKIMRHSAADELDEAIAVAGGELNTHADEMAKALVELTDIPDDYLFRRAVEFLRTGQDSSLCRDIQGLFRWLTLPFPSDRQVIRSSRRLSPALCQA